MVGDWLSSVVYLVGGESLCAGVVVATERVATAYHCVAGDRRPRVDTRDGRSFPSRVAAARRELDIAILEVPGLDVAALPLASGEPAIGTPVFALGHPYAASAGGFTGGLLAWSASKGIVGAVSADVLQVDAPMNPGNSGGPVVDEDGHIVGIASRKLRTEGIGFATRSTAVSALLLEPPRRTGVGGGWGLGVGVLSVDDLALGVHGWIALADRVVVRAWGAGVPWSGKEHGVAALSLAYRLRAGRGPYSVTVELGPGGLWSAGSPAGAPGILHPAATGRVGFSGAGVAGWYDPLATAGGVAFDVALPGIKGVL
jgi:hypothetical protein